MSANVSLSALRVVDVFRSLIRSPGRTLGVIGLLTIGLTPLIALYVVSRALVFGSLDIGEPASLVWLRRESAGATFVAFEYPVFNQLATTQAGGGEWVAAGQLDGVPKITFGGRSIDIADGRVQFVSNNYFRTLRVDMFSGADTGGNRTSSDAAIVSHGFWRAHLSSSPTAIGSLLNINAATFRIVGIAPPGFADIFPGQRSDIWLPLESQPQLEPNSRLSSGTAWLYVIGRAPRGVDLRSIESRINGTPIPDEAIGIVARLAKGQLRYVAASASAGVRPNDDRYRKVLPILLAVAVLLLVSTLVCVAAMLASRWIHRASEFTVRRALGATRGSITVQTLGEVIVVTGVSLAAASLFVPPLIVFVGSILSEVEGRHLEISSTHTLAGIASADAALFAITILVLGTIALINSASSKGNIAEGRRSLVGATRRERVILKSLVALQIAIALPLLFSAGLLARTTRNIARLNVGFQPAALTAVRVPMGSSAMRLGRDADFRQNLLDAVQRVPSVERATLGTGDPLSSVATTSSVARADDNSRETKRVRVNHVLPNYRATIGIPLVAGRDLPDEASREGDEILALLSRNLATQLWGGAEESIGQAILVGSGGMRAVVSGVVEDVRHKSVRDDVEPEVYISVARHSAPMFSLAIRLRNEDAVVPADQIRAAVSRALPDVKPGSVYRLEDELAQRSHGERTATVAAVAFCGISVLVSLAGLYWLISWIVASRQTEFALRMFLGAEGWQVAAEVQKESFRVVAGGLSIGTCIGLGTNALLSSLLFGVSPTDGFTIIASIAGLFTVSMIATLFPVRAIRRVSLASLLSFR